MKKALLCCALAGAMSTAQAGVFIIDDFNTGDNEGSSYFQVTQKRGRRFSAARSRSRSSRRCP